MILCFPAHIAVFLCCNVIKMDVPLSRVPQMYTDILYRYCVVGTDIVLAITDHRKKGMEKMFLRF